MKSILASLLVAAGAASAQQSVWGQCGGQGWSGPTTCISGSVCTFQNNWYSQCLPGTGPPPALTTTTARSTTTLTTSVRTTTSTVRPTSTAAPPPAGTGFPTASGTRFTIDGVTKYFAGTNCYWCTAGGISNADIDLVFDHLRSSGIKILRVWGFNDVNTIPSGNQVWFQHLSASGSTINTGDNGLGRIDAVVRAAERTGIKLIIPLVNNWDDYGGYSAYVRAFGGTKQTWYTNAAAQAQYRRYAEAVISRHRTSRAILAWELANEPRCQGCNVNVITEWARSTSEFFKSIAPSHMVTLGDEGFGLPGENSYPYGYSEGTDWVALLAIKTLDFATFHLYPNSCAFFSSPNAAISARGDKANSHLRVHHLRLGQQMDQGPRRPLRRRQQALPPRRM